MQLPLLGLISMQLSTSGVAIRALAIVKLMVWARAPVVRLLVVKLMAFWEVLKAKGTGSLIFHILTELAFASKVLFIGKD